MAQSNASLTKWGLIKRAQRTLPQTTSQEKKLILVILPELCSKTAMWSSNPIQRGGQCLRRGLRSSNFCKSIQATQMQLIKLFMAKRKCSHHLHSRFLRIWNSIKAEKTKIILKGEATVWMSRFRIFSSRADQRSLSVLMMMKYKEQS